MGSSAQNSSGVHYCRRRVRFNEVPEKVPKLPEKVWEALVQRFNRVRRRFRRRFRRRALVQSQVRFNRVPEKVPEKVWEALVQSQVRFNRVPKKVPALSFAARFRKICNNKTLRLLGIPPKLILHMTWENLRRILGLPGKTEKHLQTLFFLPRRTMLRIVLKSGVGRVSERSK